MSQPGKKRNREIPGSFLKEKYYIEEDIIMLKGIPKILSPELLKVLAEMGHSDRLVISDGNTKEDSLRKSGVTYGVCCQ